MQVETTRTYVPNLLNCSGVSMAIFGNRRQTLEQLNILTGCRTRHTGGLLLPLAAPSVHAGAPFAIRFKQVLLTMGGIAFIFVAFHILFEVCCLSCSFGSPPAPSLLLRYMEEVRLALRHPSRRRNSFWTSASDLTADTRSRSCAKHRVLPLKRMPGSH